MIQHERFIHLELTSDYFNNKQQRQIESSSTPPPAGSIVLEIFTKKYAAYAMGLGFIGHELAATTAQDSSSPTPSTANTTTSMSQQPQVAGPPAATSSFIPIDRSTSECDAAHNTVLVGILVMLAVGAVIAFCIVACWRRRRESRQERKRYRAKVPEQQSAADEDNEAPSRMA